MIEHSLGLPRDIAFADKSAVAVDRQLACDKHEATGSYRLRIGSARLGCVWAENGIVDHRLASGGGRGS